jgi:hypothetical protein
MAGLLVVIPAERNAREPGPIFQSIHGSRIGSLHSPSGMTIADEAEETTSCAAI